MCRVERRLACSRDDCVEASRLFYSSPLQSRRRQAVALKLIRSDPLSSAYGHTGTHCKPAQPPCMDRDEPLEPAARSKGGNVVTFSERSVQSLPRSRVAIYTPRPARHDIWSRVCPLARNWGPPASKPRAPISLQSNSSGVSGYAGRTAVGRQSPPGAPVHAIRRFRITGHITLSDMRKCYSHGPIGSGWDEAVWLQYPKLGGADMKYSSIKSATCAYHWTRDDKDIAIQL